MSPSGVTISYRLMLWLKKSGLRAFTITCRKHQAQSIYRGEIPVTVAALNLSPGDWSSQACKWPSTLEPDPGNQYKAALRSFPTVVLPHHVKQVPPAHAPWQEAVVCERHHLVCVMVICTTMHRCKLSTCGQASQRDSFGLCNKNDTKLAAGTPRSTLGVQPLQYSCNKEH